MNYKMFKCFLLEIICIAIGGAFILTYNPIIVAYFMGLYMIKELRYITFFSTAISMYIWMPYMKSTKYLMVILTIMLVIWLIEHLMKKCVSIITAAIIAGITMFAFEITDFAMSLHNMKQLEDWAIPLAMAIIAFSLSFIYNKGISYIYYNSSQMVFRNEDMVSVGILIGTITYSLDKVIIYEFQIVYIFIYLAILYLGYKYGAGMGAITASACSVALIIDYQNIDIAAVMCLAGICTGTFRELGKIGTLSGLICGITFAGVFYEPFLIEQNNIWCLGIAGVVFLFTPKALISKNKKNDIAFEGAKKYVQFRRDQKLKNVAASFEKLSEYFNVIPIKNADLTFTEISKNVEEVSKNICTSCQRFDECWKVGKYEAFKETQELFKSAKLNGSVGLRDVNRQFFNSCKNVNGLISEVNHITEKQRVNLLWYNRLVESKYAVATQLKEVSGILTDFSDYRYEYIDISQQKEEKIKKRLKSKKIIIKRINIVKNRHGRLEATVIAKSSNGICFSTKDIESAIYEITKKQMRLADSSKIILNSEFTTINFIEDVNFVVMCGTAKASKGKNIISGDNFGFTALSQGQMLMTLSDGMGYGKHAYSESETVVELLEELLETGFRNEVALKLINLVMMLNTDSNETATADLSIMDLYTGICQFVKAGAAPTFIKRGSWVEIIKSTSLPLGILKDIDLEKTSKKIYDKDIIVMVSDGVIDGLASNDKEMELCDIIRSVDKKNPKDFANEVLNKVINQKLNDVNDDMTILVGMVWAK